MRSFSFFHWISLFFVVLFQVAALAEGGRWAVVGDAGDTTPIVDQLRASVKREGALNMVMPGDNLYRGSYGGVWDSWKKEGFVFEAVAIGNHNSGYDQEVKYFGMPGEFYSVAKHGTRFLIFNSTNKKNIEAQFKWAESEIANAKESFVFLVYHHPTYTVSQSHKWTEKKKFQLRMRDFIKAHRSKITALLLGHDHMSEFMLFGDLPVLIAGSGREVRKEKPVSYSENGLEILTKYLAPETQHWALLETEEKNKTATIHFIRVKDQKRVCTATIRERQMNLQSNCLSQDVSFNKSIELPAGG